MFLKRLDIQGFKTFASRTIFDFGPGVSAIVGPNGSGKSNIADAVRWALGEQNPRAVRCRHSEDVIFAGSSKRAPVGMAEVTLTFDNSTNWLPIDYVDVAITRRAYRSGENEYLINGARVRLRDMSDLLRRASLEAGGHVVVGQGVVDTVLSQRAEERKTLVESLAGLRHYYVRRDEAEGRLRGAESNLDSLRAVIAETEPLLVTLAEQAEVARAYAGVRDELDSLLRQAYAHQHQALRARSAEARAEVTRARAGLAAAQAALAGGRERLAALGEQEGAAASELARLEAEARRSAEAREEAERDLAVARARAESQRRRTADLEGDLTRLEGRASAARDEARRAAEVLAAVAARRDHCVLEVRAATEAEAAHDETLRHGQQAVRHAEQAAGAARHHDESVARDLASAAAAVARARDETSVREAAARRTEEALVVADQARAAAQPRLTAARAAAEIAAAEAGRLEESMEAARRALDEAHASRAEARRTLLAAEGRRDMLRRWLADVERAHPLLAGQRAEDVVGSVMEALRVSRAWQAAIAAALGPVADGALVSDARALLRVAGEVQTSRGRRMAAVPLHEEETPDPQAGRDGLLHAFLTATGTTACGPGEAIVGWADTLVEDAYGGALTRRLLSRTLVVRDLESALRCRHAHAGLQVVTLAGEALLPGGALICGHDEGTTQVMDFHAELGRLPDEIEALRTRLAALEDDHTRRASASESVAIGVATARRVAGARHEEARAAAGEVTLRERLYRAAEEELRRAARDLVGRQEQLAGLEARLGPLEERARLAREARAQAEATLATVRREHGAALAARDARRAHQQTLSAALSLVRQEASTAQAAAERAAAALAEIERDLAAKESQRERLAAEATTLAEAERRAAGRREHVMEQAAALSAALGPARAAASSLRAERASAEAGLARQEGECSGLAATARAAEDAVMRADRELEGLAEAVEAELGLDLGALPAVETPQPAQSRLRALRSRLTAFGVVNQRAVSDYEATAARVTFLRDQIRDLEEGIALLRGVIDEANASVREQFAGTVAALEAHFIDHFRQLFGGGTCALRATYDGEGMPSGVEVSAQPPGKRAQDLALLSGGERALVALALLFAMLAVRPVPFCLLDEVEAALDETNIERFVSILRGLSATTQFVLITHNRGTMVQADSLYGITMAEAGASQVASLALRPASVVSAGQEDGHPGSASAAHNGARAGQAVPVSPGES